MTHVRRERARIYYGEESESPVTEIALRALDKFRDESHRQYTTAIKEVGGSPPGCSVVFCVLMIFTFYFFTVSCSHCACGKGPGIHR